MNNGIAFIYDQYRCQYTGKIYLFAKNSTGDSITFVQHHSHSLLRHTKYDFNAIWIDATPATMVAWCGELHNGIVHDPHLTASTASWTPLLSTASIDIETSCFGNQLYCIGVHFHSGFTETFKVFMLGTPSSNTDHRIQYYSSESALLVDFQQWFLEINPDLIIGWHIQEFDIRFILDRFSANEISVNLGRLNLALPIAEPGKPKPTQCAPGRPILDADELIHILNIPMDGNSLEAVAQQYLLEGKLIKPSDDKVFEIERMYRNDRHALGMYNLKDCELVTRLVHHLNVLPSLFHLSRCLNAPMSTIGSPILCVDAYYHRQLHSFRSAESPAPAPVFNEVPELKLKHKKGHFESIHVIDLRHILATAARITPIDPVSVKTQQAARLPPPQFTQADIASDDTRRRLNRYIDSGYEAMIRSRGHWLFSQESLDQHKATVHTIFEAIKLAMRHHDIVPIAYRSGRLFTTSVRFPMSQEWRDRISVDLNAILKSKVELIEPFKLDTPEFYDHVFIGNGKLTESKTPEIFLGKSADSAFDIDESYNPGTHRSDPPFFKTIKSVLLNTIFCKRPITPTIIDIVNRLNAGEFDNDLIISKRIKKSPRRYGKNAPNHIIAARIAKKFSGKIYYIHAKTGPHPTSVPPFTIDYDYYVNTYVRPLVACLTSDKTIGIDDLPSYGQDSLF